MTVLPPLILPSLHLLFILFSLFCPPLSLPFLDSAPPTPCPPFILPPSLLTVPRLTQVAITSPDPDLNADAKDYFSRHMRILEQCTAAWPMPEMQAQIDALREAFSADTSKPFMLKPSFPYNSPASGASRTSPSSHTGLQHHSSQGGLHHHYRNGSNVPHGSDLSSGSVYSHGPISPPISAGFVAPHRESNANTHSMLALATSQQHPPPPQQPLPNNIPMPPDDQLTWNPSRIFE